MKVLNIGSMNLDYVYSVDHIIAPGETQATYGMNVFLGGKGINQSIALAKAGVDIYHGGMIGEDGQVFLDACRDHGFFCLRKTLSYICKERLILLNNLCFRCDTSRMAKCKWIGKLCFSLCD